MEFDFTAEELGGLAAAQTEALLQRSPHVTSCLNAELIMRLRAYREAREAQAQREQQLAAERKWLLAQAALVSSYDTLSHPSSGSAGAVQSRAGQGEPTHGRQRNVVAYVGSAAATTGSALGAVGAGSRVSPPVSLLSRLAALSGMSSSRH